MRARKSKAGHPLPEPIDISGVRRERANMRLAVDSLIDRVKRTQPPPPMADGLRAKADRLDRIANQLRDEANDLRAAARLWGAEVDLEPFEVK